MKYNTEKSVVSPDGLGPRFGVLVGSYVAALIAPTLTLFTVEYLGWRSKVFAFTVEERSAIGSGTAFPNNRQRTNSLLAELRLGSLALPASRTRSMIAYHFSVLEVVAVYLIDPASIPVSSLVGATGFLLGIVAAVAGEIAIRAARNRVASSAIESENVLIEWTSRWPRGHRIKVQVFTMVTGLVPVGLLSFWLPPHLTVLTALVVVVTVSSTTNTVLSDRAYKLTPAGLELRRSGSGKLVTWCQFIPMSQIKYVTVLENHVILHRSGLLPSIRFDRNDLRFDDEEIINNLEEYLNRRE